MVQMTPMKDLSLYTNHQSHSFVRHDRAVKVSTESGRIFTTTSRRRRYLSAVACHSVYLSSLSLSLSLSLSPSVVYLFESVEKHLLVTCED